MASAAEELLCLKHGRKLRWNDDVGIDYIHFKHSSEVLVSSTYKQFFREPILTRHESKSNVEILIRSFILGTPN